MTTKLNSCNTHSARQFASTRASTFSLSVRSPFDILMSQCGSQRFDGLKFCGQTVQDGRNVSDSEPASVAAFGAFRGYLSTFRVSTVVAKSKHVECVLGTVQLRGTQ
jgi:hypothetical protein